MQKHFPYKKYPFYQFKLLGNEIIISVSTHYIIRMCEYYYEGNKCYFNQNNKYDESGSLQQIAAVLTIYLEDRAKKFINELKYSESIHAKLQNNSEYVDRIRQQKINFIAKESLKGIILYSVVIASMLLFGQLVGYLLDW